MHMIRLLGDQYRVLSSLFGSTPIILKSKRQGAVQTSTYGAKFSAMQTATEETITIRYMLRSLGIHVL
jgi:hypothetical protein